MRTDELCIYLSEVGLCAADYINREINASLSGGELKRIEIAMLRARGVELSVFVEPEAGIDLWSFQNLIRVFERIRDEKHGSVIIISHQERILEIADKIVVISGGEIAKTGKKRKSCLSFYLNLLPAANFTRLKRQEKPNIQKARKEKTE